MEDDDHLLITALKNNDRDIAEALLTDSNIINTYYNGKNIIDTFLNPPDIDNIKWLLDHGCDVLSNTSNHSDLIGKTPLEILIRQRNEDPGNQIIRHAIALIKQAINESY